MHDWELQLMIVASTQYSTPLEMSGMTWDNKRGWSIPRQIIDSAPMLIGLLCVASLGGKEYQSANYVIHTTGRENTRVWRSHTHGHMVLQREAETHRQVTQVWGVFLYLSFRGALHWSPAHVFNFFIFFCSFCICVFLFFFTSNDRGWKSMLLVTTVTALYCVHFSTHMSPLGSYYPSKHRSAAGNVTWRNQSNDSCATTHN